MDSAGGAQDVQAEAAVGQRPRLGRGPPCQATPFSFPFLPPLGGGGQEPRVWPTGATTQ